MSNLLSHQESMVNLDMVSNIIVIGTSIKFFYLPKTNVEEEEYLLEAWYFVDEESAQEAFKKIQKLGVEI
jgi:hypothetical protein